MGVDVVKLAGESTDPEAGVEICGEEVLPRRGTESLRAWEKNH